MADSKPADDKRARISKAQQLTMLEVLGASLILGTCLVLVNFIMKYIEFNTRIIAAKNEAISTYDQAIRNIGVCADTDSNSHLSDRELADCDPNKVKNNEVVGSLRYNVYEVMAQNADLESVARKRNEACYDIDGNRIDYNQMYLMATDDAEREQLLQATKICSALRVIPDALPAQRNVEALMASLNQVFMVSRVEPESIAPSDEVVTVEELPGLSAIPVSFSVKGSGATIVRVLNDIDRSIRDFDITTATVEWNNAGLSLQARANAYYMDEVWGLETTKTIRASDKE